MAMEKYATHPSKPLGLKHEYSFAMSEISTYYIFLSSVVK